MREKLLSLGYRVSQGLYDQPDVALLHTSMEKPPHGDHFVIEVEHEGECFVIEVREAKSAR